MDILGFNIGRTSQKSTPRRVMGTTAQGAVVVRDERGKSRAEIPEVSEKGVGGNDPLAIYKPTGAKSVNASKAMGNFTNVTYAAVNAIASEISNIQWRLFQIQKDDDHEELVDHELLTLLDGVNATMTGIEFKYTLAAHLELTGNCYVLLEGVKSDMDKPKALHFLNPGHVRVRLNKDSFPFTINHYEFTLDNKIFSFQPHEILHLKYPDPSDQFVGIGFVQTVPTWIDSDNYAMEYNRKYFLNGASFGMYIATQSNIEGNIDRIRRQFSDKYTGNENAHKVPAFPKGVDLKNSGMSHKDMDFSGLASVTMDRILMAARVSRTILGTAESDTNRATAETADYVFSKRTIKPKMLLIVSYLNEFLAPRYGDDIYITFIDPVQEDRAARITEMTAASGGVPLLTQNETRRTYLGMGDITGGDSLLAPSTMAPVGKTDTQEGEDATPNLAKNVRTASGDMTSAHRIRTGGKTAFSATKKMRDGLKDSFAKAFDKIETKEVTVKTVQDLTREEYGEHYKRFADNTEKYQKHLRETLAGINKEQEKVVLENLPEATKAIGDLFNMGEWMQVVIDLSTPILAALGNDEAAAGAALIGVEAGNIYANAATRAALDARISLMADSYLSTTMDLLKAKIAEGVAAGATRDQIAASINDVYSFQNDYGALRVARTETVAVGNMANAAVWQENGVQTLQWYTGPTPCAECASLDGQVVDIGSSFFSSDYGDGATPPLHPNCNCYTRPGPIDTKL